jgi:hypothetical protein
MLLADGIREDGEHGRDELPSWTALEIHQCPNCPLDKARHPHCPVASNLVDLVELSDGLQSYAEVSLTVTVPERQIVATTTVQRAVSSLLGLVMATSPCPRTQPLRPMARFHLPLASEEETLYRSTSMYLLAQYFLSLTGRVPDIELRGLHEIYKNLQVVNAAMAERLRYINSTDGAVNSIVLLDLLAKALPYSLDESLEDIRYLFASYLE